jgi:hypothetical protein
MQVKTTLKFYKVTKSKKKKTTYIEIPSHSIENFCHQENKKQMLGRIWGRRESFCTIGRNVK